MARQLPSKPFSKLAPNASLVAVVACALAGDALASRPQPERAEGERSLAARVGAVAKSLRSADPRLDDKLPPAAQLVQWRNR